MKEEKKKSSLTESKIFLIISYKLLQFQKKEKNIYIRENGQNNGQKFFVSCLLSILTGAGPK